MGLAVFPNLGEIMAERKKIIQIYCENLNFIFFRKMKLRDLTEWNYSYFPIIFENELQLLAVQKELNNENIFPRRYFYPSLNTLSFIKSKCKCDVSETISSTILCLPLYVGLDVKDQQKIIEIINGTLY
jgi:dTDP-4-amino-4,6-dideoxygalactose transaminase